MGEIRREKGPKEKPIKIDKVHGHTFYMYTDPSKLPLQRMGAYIARVDEAGVGCSRELFDVYQDKLDKFLEEGNYKDAQILNDQMRALRSDHSTIEIALRIADCFILIDDEPWTEISESHTTKKKQLCKNHKDILDFFLTVSVPFVSSTRSLPEDLNLLEYLKKAGRWEVQNRLIRLISGGVFRIRLQDLASS